MNSTVKMFVTKYALTDGIQELDLEVGKNGYAVNRGGCWQHFKIGKDAFRDMDSAVKDAEEKRLKKIESLKKQIAKLEKLKF